MNILQLYSSIILQQILLCILKLAVVFSSKSPETMHYYITEELPKGTVIASGASLGSVYSNSLHEKPLIINQKDNGVSSFTFRYEKRNFAGNSGMPIIQLVISGRVDREAICPRPQTASDPTNNDGQVDFQITSDPISTNPTMELTKSMASGNMNKMVQSDCAVYIRVATTNDGIQSIHQVIVYIQDINDNVPTWPMPSFVVVFKDGDPAGSKQPIPLATDSDYGINAVIVYRLKAFNSRNQATPFTDSDLITSTDMFELHKEHSTSAHMSGRLFLIAKHDIDREANPNGWDVILLASNIGSNHALSGQLNIHVNVTDINDNAPRFTQAVYQPQLPNQKLGVIPETIAVGQVVVRVRATDSDDGINGAVTYDFVSHPGVDNLRYFFEFTQVGELRIRNRLQLDKLEYHGEDASKHFFLPSSLITIEIQAVDGAEPAYAKTGYSTVKLRVEDVDDEAPVIRIHPVRSWNSQIAENVTSHAAVEIAVSENEMLGQLIALIEVNDPDNGEHEMLRCNLVSTTAYLFRLSQHDTTGREFRLYTASKLDREQTDRLLVTIECRDLADHVSSCNVGVNVIDVNDHSPQFKEAVYRFSVLEDDGERPFVTDNPPNRTWLTSTGRAFVEATDADDGDNRRIVYQLKATANSVQHLISVNPHSGELLAVGPFDREQAASHHYVVLAVDQGEPPLTGTCVVEVIVSDVNDNPPLFAPEISSGGGYTFLVPENQSPGTRIGKVEAYDVDQLDAPFSGFNISHRVDESRGSVTQPVKHGKNAYLRFSLRNEPDAKAFWIDPKSGVLITRTLLDREKQAVYTFHVVVQDNAPEEGSGLHGKVTSGNIRDAKGNVADARVHQVACLVTVSVGDENDNDPIFIRPNATNHMVLLDPAAIPGQSLHQLHAIDPDEGPNGLVTYAIRGGNTGGLFNVDPRTGLLYLESQIPRNFATHGIISSADSSFRSGYVRSSDQVHGHGGASDMWFHPTYLLSVEACDQGQPPRCSTFPNLQIQIRTPHSPELDLVNKEDFEPKRSIESAHLLQEPDPLSHGREHSDNTYEQLTPAAIVITTLSVFFSVIVIVAVITVCIARRNHRNIEDNDHKAPKKAPTKGSKLSATIELMNHQTEPTQAVYSSKMSPVIHHDLCGGEWTFANHTDESEPGTLPRAGIHLNKSGSRSMMDTGFQRIPDIVCQPQLLEQHYARKILPCDYGSPNYNYSSGHENAHDDYQALDKWAAFDRSKLTTAKLTRPDVFSYPPMTNPTVDTQQMVFPQLAIFRSTDIDTERIPKDDITIRTKKMEVTPQYAASVTDAEEVLRTQHSRLPKDRFTGKGGHVYTGLPKSSFV